MFESIGEIIGKAATYDGHAVTYTGDTTARALTVFRSGHEEPDTVVEAVQSVLGQDAKVVALGSRVLVAGKSAQVDLTNHLARYINAGPDGWRLDVRVVSISDTFRRDLGIDWDLGAQVQASIGGSTGDLAPVLTGTSASLIVRAVAAATQESREAALLHSATLYVLEDGEAHMHQGERTPIPRFQTSPEGTTTLVGYDYVSTGFELTAGARRVDGGVRLNLAPSVSTVTGFVADAPIVTRSEVTAQAVVGSGDWLVISGLSTSQADDGGTSIPGVPLIGRNTASASDASIVYLVRAQRVYASGVNRGDPR